MTEHQLSEHAWESFLTRQCSRTPLDGTVTAIMPFGAFVRFDEGVEGLLHVSEWNGEPELGSTVSVRILQLDLTRRRVSLAQA